LTGLFGASVLLAFGPGSGVGRATNPGPATTRPLPVATTRVAVRAPGPTIPRTTAPITTAPRATVPATTARPAPTTRPATRPATTRPPAPTAAPTAPAPTTAAPTTAVATRVTASTASTRRATATKKVAAPRPIRGGDGVTGFEKLSHAEWPHEDELFVARGKTTHLEIFRNPSDPGPRLRFDDRRTVTGKVSLLIVGRQDGFWRVALPVRPNGTTGWVRESDVVVERIGQRIVVELSTNTLRLYENGQVVIETKVATGTGGTPTPAGLFFVKEAVPQKNPAGSYGPIALGLSGFSEALKNFAGGSAVIALHGTNAPGSIGRAASHGCIRLPNDLIIALSRRVALGTPVEIVQRESDIPLERQRFMVSSAPIADDLLPDAIDPDSLDPTVTRSDTVDPNGLGSAGDLLPPSDPARQPGASDPAADVPAEPPAQDGVPVGP
jgi:lipoprotein-anchoring transpeptidase ErfK/SrfK